MQRIKKELPVIFVLVTMALVVGCFSPAPIEIPTPEQPVVTPRVVKMSEVEELHHWIGYKVALKGEDDKDLVYHISKAFALATESKHKSALDGILAEHIPEGHFIHIKDTLKELLGTKAEPQAFPAQLEAKLALALMKENKMDDAKAQVEHMLTVTVGHTKEEAQEALEAMLKGDMEAAGRLLTHQSGSDGHLGIK